MENAAYVWTVCRLDALLIGSLLAVWWVRAPEPDAKPLFLVFWGGTAPDVGDRRPDPQLRTDDGWPGSLESDNSRSCICSFDRGSWLSVAVPILLDCRLSMYIGRISYGIYLLHIPVQLSWQSVIAPDTDSLPMYAYGMLDLLGICISSILLASLSWFALERPLLRLKSYIPYMYLK